jgi:hypothetical protein
LSAWPFILTPKPAECERDVTAVPKEATATALLVKEDFVLMTATTKRRRRKAPMGWDGAGQAASLV